MPNHLPQLATALVRRNRRMAVAFFVLAAVVCLGNSPAQASCGDYLHHQWAMPAVAGAQPVGLLQKEPVPVKLPCHGPSCQQGNKQLPAPTPVISMESPDRWMLAVCMGLPKLDQITYLPRLNETLSFATDVYRLDRPPKV